MGLGAHDIAMDMEIPSSAGYGQIGVFASDEELLITLRKSAGSMAIVVFSRPAMVVYSLVHQEKSDVAG